MTYRVKCIPGIFKLVEVLILLLVLYNSSRADAQTEFTVNPTDKMTDAPTYTTTNPTYTTTDAQTELTTDPTDATTEVSTLPYETSTVVSTCKELGENYRVFPEDGKCYPVTGKHGGPCPYYATFLEDNEINGTCICYEEGFIYYKKSCYWLHAQGPCEISQRLTLNKNGIAFCADYVCSIYVYKRRQLRYVGWKNGQCYPEYSQGPCGEGERIVLEKRWKPECEKKAAIAGGAWYSLKYSGDWYGPYYLAASRTIDCPTGYLRDQVYGCRKEQNFNQCDSGQSWNPFARKCL